MMQKAHKQRQCPQCERMFMGRTKYCGQRCAQKARYEQKRRSEQNVKPRYTPWGIKWVGLPEDECPECRYYKIREIYALEHGDSNLPEYMTQRYQHQHDAHGIPFSREPKAREERRAEAGAQQPSLV